MSLNVIELNDTGLRVTWVPEVLREWCIHVGRTPRPHEQAAILRGQHDRIEAAAATHDVVVCDTTAMMTAVYSRLLFADRSLEERAVALQRRMALTLLTALDLPWVADPQRYLPEERQSFLDECRKQLEKYKRPYVLIGGASFDERTKNAIAACQKILL